MAQMMTSRYITLAGPSEWAVVNALWAAMEHYGIRPNEVFILHEKSVGAIAEKAASFAERLLEGYEIKPSVKTIQFPDDDFLSVGEAVKDLVLNGKKKGEVSVDITPGRKRFAVATLLAADKQGADHILYLYLENLWEANRPYPMIPHVLHRPDDLKELESHG